MNVGNISEIISALAIIVSVLYLAIQIRKQTREYRLSATRELANGAYSNMELMIQNPDVRLIYLQAMKDYVSLKENERILISMFWIHLFRHMELVYLHIEGGTVEPLFFESVHNGLKEILTFAGVQQWWGLTHSQFGTGFQDHIQDLMREAESHEFKSSFDKVGE